MSLRQWMVAATAALALSLTACGGGETDQSGNPSVVKVQRMVVFGDSLSDAGTYTRSRRRWAAAGSPPTRALSGPKPWRRNWAWR